MMLREYRIDNPFAYVMKTLDRVIVERLAELKLRPGSRVLDYGSGDSPYKNYITPDFEYQGADLPANTDADVFILPDGRLSLPNESFDLALSTQVLEHVTDPKIYLEECWRILKPGGKLLLSTHGLMVLHPTPLDLWRWTSDGLQLVITQAGFRVLKFEGVMGLEATGIWLSTLRLQLGLPRGLRRIFSVICNLIISLVDRLISRESRIKDACIFVVIAEKTDECHQAMPDDLQSRDTVVGSLQQRASTSAVI